ncbi:hypothetical protein MFM001_23250 [Mycobacterium sp. MFM001]|uniref:hypothetical protein n=1 Tax=Mycobacterium sp. MFM001 TaxID=2049453 RepID=UPI000DA5BA9E|nr:hypothetical protein [Mycobacterium sp. MFM001]GBE65863.1 hypothetical protein MFM001_23250 [Mycobacterium sp. MFM001]
MTNDTIHFDVPLPAGAVKVWDWELPHRTGWAEPSRGFSGSCRVIEGERDTIQINVDGIQWSSGQCEREIRVYIHTDAEPLTPARARQLARALIAVADECDELATYDRVSTEH